MNIRFPKTIVRIDDGEEFVLNEDGKTYSLKLMLPFRHKGHLVMDYTYDQLCDNKSFKVKWESLSEVLNFLKDLDFVKWGEGGCFHDDIELFAYRNILDRREIIVKFDRDGEEVEVFSKVNII